MKKLRIFCLTIPLLLLLIMQMRIPVSAENADGALPISDDGRSGYCGETAQWKLENGVLTIFGTGDTETFPWRTFSSEITSIVIENGINSIGALSFIGLEHITSVSFPDSVTKIGALLFENCINLSSIKLPKDITALPIGVFQSCTALTEIEIPSGVTFIGERAFYCSGIKQIALPDAIVQIDRYAFSRCANLTELHFPASVAILGESIVGACPQLKSLYFYGDFPECDRFVFHGSKATAYYPPDNETWATANKKLTSHIAMKPNLPPSEPTTEPTTEPTIESATDPVTNPTISQTPDPTIPSAPDDTVSTTPDATVDTSPGATADATTPNGTAPSGQDSTTKPAPGLTPTEPTSPNTPAKTGWVLPVVVLVGILGCGAVIWYILYKRNKETPAA